MIYMSLGSVRKLASRPVNGRSGWGRIKRKEGTSVHYVDKSLMTWGGDITVGAGKGK